MSFVVEAGLAQCSDIDVVPVEFPGDECRASFQSIFAVGQGANVPRCNGERPLWRFSFQNWSSTAEWMTRQPRFAAKSVRGK